MKKEIFDKAMVVYVNWRKKNGVPEGWYEKRPYWEIGQDHNWLCTEKPLVGEDKVEELYYNDLLRDLNEISGVSAKFARAYDTSAGVSFVIKD